MLFALKNQYMVNKIQYYMLLSINKVGETPTVNKCCKAEHGKFVMLFVSDIRRE